MKGGIDRGACFLYWKLSYRRKFIRTLWINGVSLPLFIAAQTSGVLPAALNERLGPGFGTYGWAIIAAIVISGALQAMYTYHQWRSQWQTE